MTTTTLISEKLIQKVEQAKKDNTLFLTITYDLPSENLTTIDDDLKRQFLNKRLAILSYVNCVGLRLNNSTYVVHIDRIDELLKQFETVYSEHFDRVNLKLVGNAYADVVEEVLITDIDRLKDELTKDLEILDSKLKETHADYDTYKSSKKKIDFSKISDSFEKIKKKLYAHRTTLKTFLNRIEDLGKLNKTLSDKYQKVYDKLFQYRKELLNRCD